MCPAVKAVVMVFAPDCERRFHERVPALPFLPSRDRNVYFECFTVA
ncbi:hypothetical protein OHAE_3277 [Ochrobactrum soli]|uniref:Uncharacterized protein n=1 Tax=Ochrobactrum soli TaxID=2448455 RepID=A0A2P9HGV2_9HYPH|nr:hypothetical protein OHAE_3277 [[Ochrobactrum] soli]